MYSTGDYSISDLAVLIVATARLLGFSRVGAELRGVIDAALMEMEQRQG